MVLIHNSPTHLHQSIDPMTFVEILRFLLCQTPPNPDDGTVRYTSRAPQDVKAVGVKGTTTNSDSIKGSEEHQASGGAGGAEAAELLTVIYQIGPQIISTDKYTRPNIDDPGLTIRLNSRSMGQSSRIKLISTSYPRNGKTAYSSSIPGLSEISTAKMHLTTDAHACFTGDFHTHTGFEMAGKKSQISKAIVTAGK
ncbi:hypothetical protein BD779DRAFT_1469767 [Infundibulicybe gibba]|nr:hypothetical protein BD779DRAFT_1469767 [Infundibulicybe gibba]